ncbi:MAG: dihydrodipicolinate synthase family protein [Victivallales bacterium]|nr:dihydrodipicolinate synthase family protein [Victivallales bacterium]
MKKKRIEGIVTPVVTPLTKNGNVDHDAVSKHHDFLIDNGISAIFVLGTTGGAAAMPENVQRDMICASQESIAGRVPLLVGISDACVETSLETARFAAAHGADGVVVAPPCYLPMETAELLEFYRIIAKEQPLPVYIYNMPAMTKINMPPKLIVRIAELDGVVGYKDSAGDIDAFKKVCDVLKSREDFSLLMGPDCLLGKAITLGACGGVTSGANVAPKVYIRRYQAALAHDTAEEDKWQAEVERLQAIYHFHENICCGVAAGLVKALSEMGFCQNCLTRPWKPLGDTPVIDDYVQHLKQMF